MNYELYNENASLMKRTLFFIASILMYYYVSHDFKYFGFFNWLYSNFANESNSLLMKHIFVWGTPSSALTCYILILIGWRLDILNLPRFRVNMVSAIKYGAMYALSFSIIVILYCLALGYGLKFSNSFQSIVGNLFSNFYEEIGYRALLTASTLALFRNKWVGIIVPSLIMTMTHNQYPYEILVSVFAGSAVMSFVYVKYKNLLAPVVCHQVMDMIVDTIVKFK